MRAFILASCVCAVSLFAACKKGESKPAAGLLAAGQPVFLETKQGRRSLAVGATLRGQDKVIASGPAVIEYFGGGIRFLEDGDALEVGDVPEAKVMGATVPPRELKDGAIVDRAPHQRIIAARYHSNLFTPPTRSRDPTTGDYFQAFFTPDGISKLNDKVAHAEGPRKALPPPPHRPKVAHVHAGELGGGGLRLEVTDEYAVAEADDLATAVLLEGNLYELGRATRLLLPDGAEATLLLDGRELELEGPADIRLR